MLPHLKHILVSDHFEYFQFPIFIPFVLQYFLDSYFLASASQMREIDSAKSAFASNSVNLELIDRHGAGIWGSDFMLQKLIWLSFNMLV